MGSCFDSDSIDTTYVYVVSMVMTTKVLSSHPHITCGETNNVLVVCVVSNIRRILF